MLNCKIQSRRDEIIIARKPLDEIGNPEGVTFITVHNFTLSGFNIPSAINSYNNYIPSGLLKPRELVAIEK
jgi:hypothetical protein